MPFRDLRWFDSVPAYRLASVRVCLAVSTLIFHVPKFHRFIDAYTASAFHVTPAFDWIPIATRPIGLVLMAAQHITAWLLLLGVVPRVSAWTLAVIGFYVMSLDPEFYAHNAHFHLTLLALVGCSDDRLSLRRLLFDPSDRARCSAWPERLIRIQLAIVFFYAALDKVLSPHWGRSGAVLAAQRLTTHAPGLAWIQRQNAALIAAMPGVLSVATIVTEFFLAAAFLLRPLRRVGVLVAIGFMLYLEFMVKPGLFAWDVLTALLLVAPAADRGWRALYDPQGAGRVTRRVLEPLDWMRRLIWVAIKAPERPDAKVPWLHLESPTRRAFCGIGALRALPLVFPAPVVAVLLLARFGGGFLAALGFGPWDDVPLILFGAYLASWVPEGLRIAISGRVSSERSGCCHGEPTAILDPRRGQG